VAVIADIHGRADLVKGRLMTVVLPTRRFVSAG